MFLCGDKKPEGRRLPVASFFWTSIWEGEIEMGLPAGRGNWPQLWRHKPGRWKGKCISDRGAAVGRV
jgi:hypothetical protein